MFLRKHRRVKDGKAHIYWSMVETIRTSRGPRQRTIGYLGELSQEDCAGYHELKYDLEINRGSRARQEDLFVAPVQGTAVNIIPNKVRVERVRDFGDAWAGVGLLNTAISREKRVLRDRDKLQRKIGALLKINSRAARLFEIKVTSSQEGKKKRLHLTWKRREENQDWADLSAGCYLEPVGKWHFLSLRGATAVASGESRAANSRPPRRPPQADSSRQAPQSSVTN